VWASNNNIGSIASNEAPAKSLLATPTSVHADPDTDGVMGSWQNSSTITTKFTVQRKDSPTGTWGTIGTVSLDPSSTPETWLQYRDETPGLDGASSYRIIADDGVGDSSAPFTAPTPPIAPSETLVVLPLNPSTLLLTWSDPSSFGGDAKVNVYYGTTEYGPIAGAATYDSASATWSYAVTGVPPLPIGSYFVELNVVGSNGAASDSVSSFVPAPLPALADPFIATAASTSAIDLTWTLTTAAAMDAANVELDRWNGTTFVPIGTNLPDDTTGNPFTDTGLAEHTDYTYRLVVTDPWATLTSAPIDAFTIPAAPSAVTATDVDGNTVNLSWTNNSSTANGFRIERSTG